MADERENGCEQRSYQGRGHEETVKGNEMKTDTQGK